MNWMRRWGFLTDPLQFAGKTIARVEVMQMQFGCTHDRSIAFEFTDGTRGWVLGHGGQHCEPSPNEESLRKSMIVKPVEVAEYIADQMRKRQDRESRALDAKRRQLQQLKEELGE